jgi:glutamine amidotransferase
MKIVIVDYKMGNIQSVARKLKLLGLNYEISNNHDVIQNADKLILPGVGHFGKALGNLKEFNLIDTLHEVVVNQKKPILGICLGMQLMAKSSEEGQTEGLGWFDAEVVHFLVKDSLRYKVPHIGWNEIDIKKESSINLNLKNESEFYFVHSFHWKTNESADVLHTTFYENEFVSAVQKDNIVGVQYHPEKSHENGIQLIKNFIFEF